MSSEPLDVSLRVRMRYEAAGTARQVTGDLDQVRTKAQQLGAISTGDRLGRDLRGLSGQAQAAKAELAGLNAMAAKLGVENGASRLEGGLKRIEAPAAEAARRIEATHQAAVRLGTGDPAGRLASGLDAVGGAGERAGRGVEGAARAAGRLGGVEAGGRLEVTLKGVDAAAGQAARSIDATAQAAVRFGASSGSRELTRDLGATTRAADTTRREMVELTMTVDRLGQGRSLRVLVGDLSDAGRAADGLQRRMEGLHRSHGSVPGSGSRRERFAFANEALMASGLGGGLRLGMGGAAAGGLVTGGAIAATAVATARASREAISFESAMAEVQKAVNDLTPEKFAEMERTILRSSRATGIQKEQMAALVAQAGFAGRPTEDLARFAEFGAKAAGAFGMTAEATGDALAKMGNVFKLPQAGIEDLADGINVLGDTTAAKERQIVDFLYRTGSTGQALKLTALQTAAVGAAVISTGKEAEVAATGFNALATKLGTADHQGKEFQQGLRALGLNGRRVKAEMAANPVEGLLNVLERINKLPDNKKLDVTTKIGGMEYGDDLLSVAGAVDQIRAALGRLTNQADRAGSVEKTFKIFDATTERSIARMTANIDAFAARVGQRFTPAIRESAGAVERWFGGMVKALELADRAAALSAKQLKGETLSKPEQDELAANPRLRAETDRRVTSGREDAERRAIVEEDGRRLGARPRDPAAVARAARPRQPDEQDAAAAEARERTRQRLGAEIKELEAEIETRRSGGFETTADRRRLRGLRRQYDQQFPAAQSAPAAEPAARPAPAPAPSTPVPLPEAARPPAAPAVPAPPAPGRQSALADEARVSLASYHDTVERSMARTERLVHDAGRRMREDLAIGAKVDLAALRLDPSQQIRIERVAYGGAAVGVRPGAGVVGSAVGGWPTVGGMGVGGGSRAGATMPRVAPGRFGITLPGARLEGGDGADPGSPRPGGRQRAGLPARPERYGGSDGGGERAPGATPGAAGGSSAGSLTELIDREATRAGIDPRLMHGIRAGESGRRHNGDNPRAAYDHNPGTAAVPEDSWGPFQLNRRRGLGQEFERETGLDLSDHRTIAAQARWVADHIAKRQRRNPNYNPGREWMGFRGLRQSDPSWGDAGYVPERNAAQRAAPSEAGENGQVDPLGGATRRYSSGFGMRDHPVHGGRRMHYGQDMAAPAGTPVNSMQAGRISRIDRSGDVTVTHADGSTKTYRHIAPAGIREGQNVEAGGPIGRLRAHDPRSTGPHLHLEATDANGRRYDPRAEIEAARRRGGDAAGQPQAPAEATRPAEGAGLRQLRPWTAQPPGEAAPERPALRSQDTEVERPQRGDAADRRQAPAETTRPPEGAGLRQLRPWTAQPPGEAAPERPALRSQDAEVERPQLERAALRFENRPAPKPADLALPRRLPQADDPRAPSPRFAEPRQVEARRRPERDGPGQRSGGGAQVAAGGPVTQNFHGGFDAGEVARRSTLERNREIRRSQAGALHSIGRIA